MSDKTELLQGIRVLVVEDSELVLHLIERQLKKWGVELTVAHDGLEGVQQVAAHRFDIVLMDVNLPGMDGIEAAREIRKLSPNLPVLAMTGNDDAPSIFHAHIRKPVNKEELYSKMVKTLLPHI